MYVVFKAKKLPYVKLSSRKWRSYNNLGIPSLYESVLGRSGFGYISFLYDVCALISYLEKEDCQFFWSVFLLALTRLLGLPGCLPLSNKLFDCLVLNNQFGGICSVKGVLARFSVCRSFDISQSLAKVMFHKVQFLNEVIFLVLWRLKLIWLVF